MKGKVSKTGYRKDSKDRHNDFNIVPSNFISMKNVEHPVWGIDNLGNSRLMYPNEQHRFPGTYVTEFPMPGYHQMPDGSMMADNEMKRGGQHNKRKTSKNIKSSINELFLRNYQVYGPHGHHNIYDPNAKKEGGEHMKKLIPMPPIQFFYNGHAPNPWMEMGGEIDFDDPDYEEFKQGGIHIAKNKRGTFTAAATKHGQGVQEFARHVLANKDKFSPAMVKKAVFAHNAAGWKHQLGGESDDMDFDQDEVMYKKGGHWIQNAVNPAHKGYCTPMTKSTCTPKRKAFAMTMKKHHGFHQQGGIVEGDYENNFDNPFFQMGGFNPPAQATKVTSVPEGYNQLGTFGNKTYYDVQAKKAVAGTKGGGKAWEQSIINMLQSGTSPQALVQAGHISPDQAGKFQQYYKPVYTEADTAKANNISIPLDSEDRIDRKEVFLGNKDNAFKQYLYPDPHAGYTKPTKRYFDTTTGKEIDPLKSYSTGAYNPFYIENPDSVKGTVKHTRGLLDASGVIKPTGNATINTLSSGFKEGGEFLKSLVKNAYKDVMKKGGESAPQGMTGDEVLQNRNNTFRNYLSNNAMKAIALEEIQNLQDLHNYMKCGGMYQQGGEPENSDAYWNTLPGYNGGAEMGTASAGNGVVNMAVPQFYPPVQNNGVQPMTSNYSLSADQGINPQRSMYDLMSNDIQNSNFQQPQQQNQSSQNWFQRNKGPAMAEGIIAGLNFGTAALNQKNVRANENLLKQRMSADNVFMANQFGNANRGQYDTNSGVFKPNQYTFSQNQGNMEMGGEHEGEWMTEAEIKKLKKAGYTIQYLD